MKNPLENNYSGKNSKKHKNNFNSDFYSKKTNSSRKNRFSSNSSTNRGVNNFDERDKKKSNFSSENKRKSITKSNTEISYKNRDLYRDHINKKNFDDWIWGKHSVEALISKRAINRICVHRNIFFREINTLFKDLKLRFSLKKSLGISFQLTFGLHQGVALQLHILRQYP